ncbi:MAG: elongation factor G, partial [Rubritalea sp.]
DPTFIVKTDEDTGQCIIAGMGELHLEVIVDRLKREFKVDARTGTPQIAYRETISKESPGTGVLKKQTGGAGQYAKVDLVVRPAKRGAGLSIENKITGGAIPKEFIKAVYNGIDDSTVNGVIAGYPVVDLHVIIVDGDAHDVDSNENAFHMATIFAMRDALEQGSSLLLEPVMDVEVTTPDEYQGDILGDLSRRRGQIAGMEGKGLACTLKATVPLAEMFGYMTALRTVSSGRASFTMEPASFEPVPQAIVEQKFGESM